MITSFKKELDRHGFEIRPNNVNEIYEVYRCDEDFAKLSNNFPVSIDAVIDEINSYPPSTTINNKYYVSIYNLRNELVAVIDFIDEYSYKGMHGCNGIWIGLLLINKNMQNEGYGRKIIESFEIACLENRKEIIQLGVIKDNEKGSKFWSKMGFRNFTEINNGDFDLVLMEKWL